jgi:hypothetical protein
LGARAYKCCSRLSHAGIYWDIINGPMMTSDGPWAAARQIQLFITQLSCHRLSLPPPPPIDHHRCRCRQQRQAVLLQINEGINNVQAEDASSLKASIIDYLLLDTMERLDLPIQWKGNAKKFDCGFSHPMTASLPSEV